jgi:hypothetical protein
MNNYLSFAISVLAFFISGMTFWLTRIKRGRVKMTKPTIIFFGPDGVGEERKKIFIRTLLYSSSERGQYIQNMFIRLQRGESTQNFNVWVYGQNELVRGSGLYINQSGIASNHHFLLPKDGLDYDFKAGEYNLQLFVETVDQKPQLIFEQNLSLTQLEQETMLNKRAGIYFDWAPNTQNYFPSLDIRPRKELNNI